MPKVTTTGRDIRQWLLAAVVAAAFAMPVCANAQVVVVANGSPITELDIQQRTKLLAAGQPKPPGRQEVIQDLIDDRIKIAKAKIYGLEATDQEVDNSFANMAQRQRLTAAQFAEVLGRAGISAGAVKARLRAQITWTQLVRGKYSSSLQVNETDISDAMRARNESDVGAVGYLYVLYPVTVVAARGSSEAVMAGKRAEAESLRSRFTTCNQGLAMARAARDVAVREPVNKSSAELEASLREILANTEVGRLTAPEVTAQGLQMYALCSKKESRAESPLKRELRETLFNQRFEHESKKFLEEIRKSAMIEYRNK
ncbi:MAG: SurA N-terminal domain-containing protein [Pseudolabrys sp.]